MKHHRAAFEKRGLLAMRADFWGMLFDVDEPSEDFELRGNAAIVSIEGPLTHHREWWWDSYEAIKGRVSAALASAASTVVLRIDSPGGEVAGCFETVLELRALAAKSGKRIVSYADGMAASAGYALACAGDAIFLPPTGFVGSIGVISTLFDEVELDRKIGLNFAVVASGERKRYGHPNVAISDAAIADTQRQVDGLAALFFELVSGARGLSAETVASFKAGMFLGKDSVGAGLATGVCTFDELLANLASGADTTGPTGAAAEAGMGWKEEMKKAAEEGDEDAKKALDALSAEEEPAPKSTKESAEEEPAPKSTKESAEEPAPESKDDKTAARHGQRVRPVASIEQRVARIEQREERDRLLASRPDLMRDPALRKKLVSAPLDAVRWNVENLPRVAASGKAPASANQTDPRAHAGATIPTVTRSGGEGEPPLGVTRKSDRAKELDAKFGLAPAEGHVVDGRNFKQIALMTPSQAREHVKRLDAQKSAALNAQTGGK